MRCLLVFWGIVWTVGEAQFQGPPGGGGLLGGLGDFLGRMGVGSGRAAFDGPQMGPPMGPGFGHHGGQGDFGSQLGNLMNSPGVQNLLGNLGETINGVARAFFAPQPVENGVPPHVVRRAIRFCRRHPDDPRCRSHPEWNVGGELPSLGPLNGAAESFPGLLNFRLPPIPRLALENVLANVPRELIDAVPAPLFAQISDTVRQTLLRACADGSCKKSDAHSWNLRASVAEHEAAFHRTLANGITQEEIDKEVETRMARTHQLKRALLKKAGLDAHIEPRDDGVFQNDILLTEDQANRMINQVENDQPGQVPVIGGGRRRRSAVFVDQDKSRRWPSGQPIRYMFDPKLSPTEQNQIQTAINEIQLKTCLRFQKITSGSGHYIYYSKWTVGGFCGLSHIGMKSPGPNLVYLSFGCGNEMGVALHETLHAVGLNHEQIRGDRDQYITVNWENVDPRQYDFFAMADTKEFTSYGVKYDYGSIMHYNRFVNTQYPNKPTMTAIQNPNGNNGRMGQRSGMSGSDVRIVQKMYCLSAQCVDTNVYCGAWALRGFCSNSQWLQQNCRKSCALCH